LTERAPAFLADEAQCANFSAREGGVGHAFESQLSNGLVTIEAG